MSETSTTRPNANEVEAMAKAAGVPVTQIEAERIVQSIGPAFDGFASIAGTLAFELEPAKFTAVQIKGAA